MNNYDINRFSHVLFAIGTIVLCVGLWGLLGLKIEPVSSYPLFIILFTILYFGIGYLVRIRKISRSIALDLTLYTLYIYACLGSLLFSTIYAFAFFEVLGLCAIFYKNSFPRFFSQLVFGIILAFFSFEYMPEPEFVREGYSINLHYRITTIITGFLAVCNFWFFSRQRELLNLKERRFASIGRQSAFLLHELKSPLSRFMASSSHTENRDAEYILSIVEGVELLITNRENLKFESFSWEEVKNYIKEEFIDFCTYYKINLDIEGFDGEGTGHISTIKLALRNLVKNAFESIVSESQKGTVKVLRTGNEIIVQNSGPKITKEMLNQLFTPFYTDKHSKNNFGIGLHFVENVVKAHNGSIVVDTDNDWTTFRMKLGGNE